MTGVQTCALPISLKTASASLPLPDQGARPLRAISLRLRRAAAVAASQRLERGTSPVRHRVPSEESVLEVSATEPVLPGPTTVPKKKAVVLAAKQKSPEFIESFTSSSEFLDDSVTPLAALCGSLPSRGKKARFRSPRGRAPAPAPQLRGSLCQQGLRLTWGVRPSRLRRLLQPRRLVVLLTLRPIQRPSHCTYRSS